MAKRGLTKKQLKFIDEYLRCDNAAEAYRLAYPGSKDWTVNALNVNAHRNLNKPNICLRIQAIREEAERKIAKKYEVTLDRLTKEYARIAFLDFRIFFKSDGNPVKAAMILGESTMMKARYKKGFERDVANAMRRGGNDLVAQSRRITDRLMVLTSLGDRIAITLGGYAVYRHHLEQNKKAGMGKKQAHQEALTKFEMATERSQQSGNVKDLGGFQRGTPLMKLFTMYMTAPASYSRQIFTAIRHAKDSPANSAKRLFIYGVVLPSLFQAVTDAFMIFGGDDEDEERFWKNQAKALALGPFNGLPVIRTMMEGYANTIAGNSFYGDQYTPVMQAFATSKDMVGNTVKWSEGGTPQINGGEYLMRALWDAVQLGGYVTGIPVRPMAKVASGIKDAVSGETKYPVRRSLGYSPHIVGEK